MRHIESLDGYRFLAAIIVLVGHFSNETGMFGQVLGAGAEQIGVVMFFCLSGFFMGGIYFEKDFNPVELTRYILRRFGRVIPLFYFMLALGFLISLGNTGIPFFEIDDRAFLMGLALVDGPHLMWTIVTECRFYLLFPLVWLAVSRKPGAGYPILLILIIGGQFISTNYTQLPKEALFQYIQIFCAGILTAILYRRTHLSGRNETRVKSVYLTDLPFVASAISLLLFYPRVQQEIWGTTNVGNAYGNPYLVVVCCIFLFFTILSPLAQKILGNSFARFGGRVSFSIYLWHMPVIWLLLPLLDGFAREFQFLLILSSTMLASSLSYTFIEIPGQNLFRRIERQIDERQFSRLSQDS